MSTKTSPLNISTTSSATSSVQTSVSSSTAQATISTSKIKKELPSDEIKEFAETTMNELLGWYGFDGVDRLDFSSKASRFLQSAAIAAATTGAGIAAGVGNIRSNYNGNLSHDIEKRRSHLQRTTSTYMEMQQSEKLRNFVTNNNNINNNNNNNDHTNSNKIINNSNYESYSSRRREPNSRNYRSNRNNNIAIGSFINCGGGNESTTSDHDTRSSREEDSKSPHLFEKSNEEKIDLQNCCWCRRSIPENAPDFLTTSDGPRYCSESCFTQSRRASFKKAKTCDWCKHVRHAVSYVDFQDGASQLQFCSDKCLNQYKMQIFCKETQAHLDMNPHLRDQGLDAAVASNGLITPDLWLRNCRSRSASPASTISVSPGLTNTVNMSTELSISSPRVTSPPNVCQITTIATSPTIIHKPMISVAPASKLMSKSPGILQNRQSPKHCRKKRPIRTGVHKAVNDKSSTGSSNTSSCSNTIIGGRDSSSLITKCNSSTLNKSKLIININPNNNNNNNHNLQTTNPRYLLTTKSNTPTLNEFAGSSVQDLHMNVPPLSPMMEQPTHAIPQPHVIPKSHNINKSSAFFGPVNQNRQNSCHLRPSAGYSMQQPFISNQASLPLQPVADSSQSASTSVHMPQRFGNGFLSGLMQQPIHLLPPFDGNNNTTILGAPPPVTIMVPYPIIIPLPLPIPVPLPVMDFYKAYLTPEERNKLSEIENINKHKNETKNNMRTQSCSKQSTNVDEPLDFTKSKDYVNINDSNTENNILNTKEIPTEKLTINENSHSLEPNNFEDIHVDNPLTSSNSNDFHSIVPTTTTVTSIINNNSIEDVSKVSTIHKSEEISKSMINEKSNNTENDARQKLPKFKITRLLTKRTLIQTKESECSRPLRKRKRIIDCDFQKLTLRDAETDEDFQTDAESTKSITTATTNEKPSVKALKIANESKVTTTTAVALATTTTTFSNKK